MKIIGAGHPQVECDLNLYSGANVLNEDLARGVQTVNGQ